MIKTTQTQLKDVKRLLKLDPSNTGLLSQKQRILKESISATKDKLDSLKTAQEQAKQQLENGTLGQDKYDALQRKIIETEEELKRFAIEAANGIIDEILLVALMAPTSFGHKAVEFFVVSDSEAIQKLGACKTYGGSQINGADIVIVTMVRRKDKRQAEFWIEDGAIASAYLLLAAEQYGIGACWVQIRNRIQSGTSDEEIRALLGAPSGYTVLNLVALGIKGEDKMPYTDKDIDMGLVHYGKF